ncbi:MAG: hypothetical protein HKL96_13570 [Phycisphaerales bacterium]|nr:hypothetical protein [Phycisphaerales bacterium]
MYTPSPNSSIKRIGHRPAALVLAGIAALALGVPARGSSRWVQHAMLWPSLSPHLVSAPSPQQQAARQITKMLHEMQASAGRLQKSDAGSATQDIQHRIVTNLDALIQMAQQQQSSGGGSSQASAKQQGQQLQQSQGSGPQQPNEGPSQAARNSKYSPGVTLPAQFNKPFDSNKRQWGNLPARERNLIINGIRKGTLPQYRSLVNAYYEALGRLNETAKH